MVIIRNCEGFAELDACVELQVATWGLAERDVIPSKVFRVAQRIGGQVMGAFNDQLDGALPLGGPESLVGFAFSLPGVKNGEGGPRPYLHSHMLAVRESHRNLGLGTLLKLEQRREALARGIRHMEWTFDPLEIKNAYLNIHKLGAVVREYEVDFYGVFSSRLQAGLPTDRLVAEWELDSPRVHAILEGRARAARGIEERIAVPALIYEWKATEASRDKALAVLLENRGKFQRAFSKGLAVVGFVLDAEGNGVFELGHLAQPEPD